jgi:hypothetical protein
MHLARYAVRAYAVAIIIDEICEARGFAANLVINDGLDCSTILRKKVVRRSLVDFEPVSIAQFTDAQSCCLARGD